MEKLRPLITDLIYFEFKKLGSLFMLRSFLIKNQIDNVIINTAQGNVAWKFMLLPFPKKIQFFGIIHNVKKLYKSFGQKNISRKIKHYYLLAEYLENFFPQTQKLQKQSFSPAFFRPFEQQIFPEKGDDCWICVPGGIEYKRRDYDFLFSVFQQADIPKNTKFILLGNAQKGDGQAVVQKIKSAGLTDFFIWFEDIIPNDTFLSYVNISDFLLPLIHGNLAENYMKYKISGTFVLSDAFGKTMLCDEVFSQVKGFDYNALYYKNEEDFIRLLQEKKAVFIVRNVDFEENRLKYVKPLGNNSCYRR